MKPAPSPAQSEHMPDDGWVLIAPFRAHFQRTCEASGLTPFALGQICGLPVATARRLAGPPRAGKERLRRQDAQAVYGISAQSIRAMARERVDCTRARRRLARMTQLVPLAELALLGCLRVADLQAVADGRWETCSRLLEVQILALADVVLESQPTPTRLRSTHRTASQAA
ncbi:hypothetical protein ACTQ49_04165 [Luteococcus sp. Sow4_B9]|uniref:hypothetical protein n=1 Tax=Luteococcus sp. Sow4_B9 TaxID=3438792 RepID=UPI003F9EADD7